MNTALIVAAGISRRTKLDRSKILYPIDGKPLFLYSIEAFSALGYDIILVVAKNDIQEIKKHITSDIRLVIGGKTRSESVLNGLKEVTTPYVFIHDAARPLITKDTISQIERALTLHDAVLLAEPVTSALKHRQDNTVKSLDRNTHVLAQTPQAFLTEKIRYAHLRNDDAHDDDIALYQQFYPSDNVHVVINDRPNLKVTFQEDLTYVSHVLTKEQTMRIGHSFDIHQLTKQRPLLLGGINIPHDKGLAGHSDADVLLHVIAEAMLGALALGDLGTHFPNHDPQYENMSSTLILKHAHQCIIDNGYDVVNMDATIYAELPKLNPYIKDIRTHIANHLGIHIEQVSIKATTYEKLDAIGRGEAIAAEAVVLLKKV